jgi:hypothetical protein
MRKRVSSHELKEMYNINGPERLGQNPDLIPTGNIQNITKQCLRRKCFFHSDEEAKGRKIGRQLEACINVVVHSQDDVDSLVNGCFTITGKIEIATNYTGSFNLSGVSFMTGFITTSGAYSEAVPGLTSVTLNDLEYISHLYLRNVSSLSAVSAPKLTQGISIQINTAIPSTIDFPLLENAGDLYLLGNITR